MTISGDELCRSCTYMLPVYGQAGRCRRVGRAMGGSGLPACDEIEAASSQAPDGGLIDRQPEMGLWVVTPSDCRGRARRDAKAT